MSIRFVCAILAAATAGLAPLRSLAQERTDESPVVVPASEGFFSTALPHDPNRPRNPIWPPILSTLLPGFDQWYEGQEKQATFYSGVAIGGIGLISSVGEESREKFGSLSSNDLESRDNETRTVILGSQLYSAAGSLSAYASFRAAVRTRQPIGEYQFLTHEETTDQLLLSPLQFKLLKKPTTFVPLLLAVGIMAADLSDSYARPLHDNAFNGSDLFFGSSFSYLAGTHEEALFRGWMMPIFMEGWNSAFWSNTATAFIFALGHLSSDNPVPWPQFALGWYLGYLAQENEWTLQESVFVHAWWDAIIFAGTYLDKSHDKAAAVYLPVVTATF